MRILLFIGRCSTVRRGSSSSPHPLPYFSSLKISSVASSPPALLLCVLPAHLGCEPPLHGVQSIRPRHLLPANCQEAAIWSQGIYGNIGLSPLEEATALLLVLAEPRRLLYILPASAGSSSCCSNGSLWLLAPFRSALSMSYCLSEPPEPAEGPSGSSSCQRFGSSNSAALSCSGGWLLRSDGSLSSPLLELAGEGALLPARLAK